MEDNLKTYASSSTYGIDNAGNEYEYSFEFKCNPEISEELRMNLLNACLVQVVTYSKKCLDGREVSTEFIDPFFPSDNFAFELNCKDKQDHTPKV